MLHKPEAWRLFDKNQMCLCFLWKYRFSSSEVPLDSITLDRGLVEEVWMMMMVLITMMDDDDGADGDDDDYHDDEFATLI